jgi:Yip1 domain
METAVGFMSRLKWVMFLGPVVIVQPIFMAAAAFVFYLVFRVLGSAQSYRQSFAVVVHAFLPLAVAALLSVPVLLGRDSISTEELMGGGILASNLGFLAADDSPPWMGALLQGFDFFTLWIVVLLVIGYRQSSRAANPTVAIAVLSLWGLWILIRVGMASLASLAT